MEAVYREPEWDSNAEWEVLKDYVSLVKRIASQLFSRTGEGMSREDMEQTGLIALLDAYRRYGAPDQQFGAYAAVRVRGGILDELRRQDWRRRSLRQQAHRARDMERELRRQLGREASDEEMCMALDLSLEDYHELILANQAEAFACFDESLHADALVDNASPERLVVQRRSLAQALGGLDEREQRVIQLYYEFDMGLKEISAILEVKEARVSQIHRAALAKMRNTLTLEE
ncbi:RNA polymerase sigma factor FliA [Chromobacterium haemolyticum]|uniref:RNA polymerase sigma factor FliA n=1 Tax=Chromobacterium haemolyticum TaxID=394935 RepID=UPI0009D9444E|nr:RNA polymerase sigma factor FliA [Chromobacterium haemolyticum]OQS33871.1 RNA polymerase sigma factor FliA [Chromobacterium haemolyticum]